jgi:hypothetical protein
MDSIFDDYFEKGRKLERERLKKTADALHEKERLVKNEEVDLHEKERLIEKEADALLEEEFRLQKKEEILREEIRTQERERLQREFESTREKDKVEFERSNNKAVLLIVQNMLKNKVDIESIHKYTKIPINEILMIKNKL